MKEETNIQLFFAPSSDELINKSNSIGQSGVIDVIAGISKCQQLTSLTLNL